MSRTYPLVLPIELLAAVGNELDAADYGALRLSCKQVEAALFPFFASKFFSARRVFQNHYSLSVLKDISESRLSPFVKTVVMGIELLPQPSLRTIETTDRAKHEALYLDDMALLPSGKAQELVTLTFVRLSSLVGLEVRDYYAIGRTNNLPRTELLPEEQNTTSYGYGLRTIMGELGFSRRPIGFYLDYISTSGGLACIQLLLTAAARAKKNLRSFRIVRHFSEHNIGPKDVALHIASFQRAEIQTVIAGVQELTLDVSPAINGPLPFKLRSGTFSLREFLGYPTKLLRLHLTGAHVEEIKEGFWGWLAAEPPTVQDPTSHSTRLRNPPPVSFGHLQDLLLGEARIPLHDLIGLLRKVSPTLTKLAFLKVCLASPSVNHENEGGPDNLWTDLFHAIAWICDHLQEIDVADALLENSPSPGRHLPNQVFRRVCLVQPDLDHHDPSFQPLSFRYKNHDVRDFLHEVAKDIPGRRLPRLVVLDGLYRTSLYGPLVKVDSPRRRLGQ